MITVTRYEADIDNLEFGHYDSEIDEFFPLNDQEQIETFMERENWEQELIESIAMFKDSIKEMVKSDLVSIQERLDRLEGK